MKKWILAGMIGLGVAVVAAIAATIITVLMFKPTFEGVDLFGLIFLTPTVLIAQVGWGLMVGFFAFLFALSRF